MFGNVFISKLQNQSGLLYYVCSVQRGHSINYFVADLGDLQKKPKAPLWEQERIFRLNSNCKRMDTAVGNRRNQADMEKSLIPIPVLVGEATPVTLQKYDYFIKS